MIRFVAESRLLIRICIGKCLNSILGDRVSYAHVLSPVERVTSVWDPDPINVSICRPKANFSPAHVVSNFFVFSNALCLERYLEKRVEGGCLSTLWYCKQTNFIQNTRVNSFNESSSFLQCCFRNVLFFNSLDTIASFSQLWFLLFFSGEEFVAKKMIVSKIEIKEILWVVIPVTRPGFFLRSNFRWPGFPYL